MISYLKTAFFLVSWLLLMPFMLSAAPGWAGDAGKAPTPTVITEENTAERGTVVKVTAVSDGMYQGATLRTAAPVPLVDGGKITFDLRQAVRGNKIAFALVVRYSNGKSAIRHASSAKKGEWETITLSVSADADYKGTGNAPLPPGSMTAISVYPFAALDTNGLYYEIAAFRILNAAGQECEYLKAGTPAAKETKPAAAKEAKAPAAKAAPKNVDATYIKPEYWQGESGQAKIAPEITLDDSPNGPAIFAKAQGKGNYQGIRVDFPEPVDLTDVGTIEFDFYQNVRVKRPGDAAIIIRYDAGRNGLLGNFKFGSSEWSHVSVPVDLRTLKALAKQSTPTIGKVMSMSFSLYSIMSAPGHTLGVANLRFVKKNNEIAAIPVSGYTYVSAPTSGDSSKNILTDGNVDKKDQAFYRVYADEPEIIFDLGAVYLVKSVSLSSVAVPSQNISDYTVSVSNDGRNFRTAAYISNKDADAAEKAYSITGENLSIAGRYIKLRIGRSRTDFPVHIAEVAFTGKIPTDQELADVAAANYSVGPEMPAVTEKDYVLFKGPQGLEVAFSRKNGVAVQFRNAKEILAERIFNGYEILGEKAKPLGKSDGYSDRVTSIRKLKDAVEIVTVNPSLPNMEFTSRYRFVAGNLSRKLTVTRNASDDRRIICHTSLFTALPRDMREGGVYESWGSGHDLQHRFASEIIFDYPADNASVVVFESPKKGKCFLAYRFRYNDRYVQIGSGTMTVSGFGEKRTHFTPNGWTVADGIFCFGKECTSGSVESMLSVCDGDLTAAFDHYLALPEVRAFRARIKRAGWLKDLRLYCSQGWDGLYGDTGKRIAGFHSSLIREGYISYIANDSDYHWGDFPTSGTVRNMFGSRMKAEDVRQRSLDIHKEYPNVKLSQYTWLWSASPESKPFREHPEWFTVLNAQGQKTNFFPGWGANYYRLVGIPGSRDEILEAIPRFVDYYDNDVWYLDGGGSPAAIDWNAMRIDEPDAYENLLLAIREKIQKGRPDRAVFFNNPETPVGDMGYLESFGGVMTTNWRDGATWMYKFKLWQRPDPIFSPLYIYWLPGVDKAFRQYAAGTGLNLTFGGSFDRRRDVGIMQVQHQSRFVKLVSANIEPNWRYDSLTQLELMPLTFGKSGWLYVKNHDSKPYSGPTRVALAPLGVSDAKAPVYTWCFTLLDHKNHKDVLGERELEENYRNHRWAGDFIVRSDYQGAASWTKDAVRQIALEPEEMKLLYFTQSPAVVYSVDALRMQLLLDATLGVSVSGRLSGREAALTVESSRKEAEIACLIPDGTVVSRASVNGKATAAEIVCVAGTRLALIPVGQGRSSIAITFAPCPPAPETCALTIRNAAPGKTLAASWTKPGAALLAVYDATTLVRNVPLAAGATEVSFAVPSGATDNAYEARLLAADGTVLAKGSFKLSGSRPKIGRFGGSRNGKMEFAAKTFERPIQAGPGVKVLASYTDYQPSNGIARVRPEEALMSVETHPAYENMWNALYAGLEMELKRFIKVRLKGNFIDFEKGPRSGAKSLSHKYDNPNSALGLMFDFADGSGKYSSRTLASVGLAQPKRTNRQPVRFGANKVPDIICIISSYALEYKEEETIWIDLKALGAPETWTGKTLVTEIFDNITPTRSLEVRILESRDELPAGAAAQKLFWLKGGAGTELKTYKLPSPEEKVVVDGRLDEKEWKGALKFTDFTRTGNPAQSAPKTVMMLRREGDFLCLGAELTEPREEGFMLDKTIKIWFTDCVEIYLQSQDAKPSYVQHIFSLSDRSFSHWVSAIGAGTKSRELAAPEYKLRSAGKKTLFLEAKIPLSDLGNLKSGKVRFNLARSRMVDANLEGYSLVPGKAYLNFDGAEFGL